MLSLTDRFAANLRAARTRAHVSQSMLARAAGVAPGYVSMLENAQRDPPLTTVAQFAKALNVDPLSLLAAPTAA